MGILDIYNKTVDGAKKLSGSLSSVFQSKPITYDREEYLRSKGLPSEKQVTPTIPKGTVNPALISKAIRDLESSGGLDPNTPRNMRREYIIPALNGNEKQRKISYDIGYGGEYGLTPDALAELAKSKANKNAPLSEYTEYGAPLLPGKHPDEIQQKLMTPEGAGELANEFFMMKRQSKEDFTPESLANDYMEYYVGNGGPSYTPKNRERVLNYFKNIMEK